MNISAALPTFVVTLREGFEAALVVGIVLACLKKSQQTQLNRWVYIGILMGLIVSVLVGLLLGSILQGLETSESLYAPVIKEGLEAGFGLIAIAMLSWMLIWMTQQAKSIKSELEGAINTALQQKDSVGWGIFTLIFIAVLREGFETVLFIIAKFQQSWIMPFLGSLFGLFLAAFIGILLFKWGIKINVHLFFQTMGIFLLLIIGGLVVGVLHKADESIILLSQLNSHYATWCTDKISSCILGIQVWDATEFLPDKEFPGILLKTLFGYRQTLYLIQAIAYLLFLAIIGGTYFQNLTSKAIKNEQKV